MRLDTDSADLRQRLARVERERDATQRENAELRERLRDMVEQASQPRGTYRPRIGLRRVELPPIEWEY